MGSFCVCVYHVVVLGILRLGLEDAINHLVLIYPPQLSHPHLFRLFLVELVDLLDIVAV